MREQLRSRLIIKTAYIVKKTREQRVSTILAVGNYELPGLSFYYFSCGPSMLCDTGLADETGGHGRSFHHTRSKQRIVTRL